MADRTVVEAKEAGSRYPMRVLWVSHSFGYGNDLMYFGEIFRTFRSLVQDTAVVVDAAKNRMTPFRNPYGLKLLPILRQFCVPVRRRGDNGAEYRSEVVVPDPLLAVRVAAQKVDVLITIEFTPPALLTMLASRALRRKALLLLIESDPSGRGGSRNPLVLKMKRTAVSLADTIQTNNENGRRYLVEELCADPSRIVVAPYLTSRPPGPEVDLSADGPNLRLLFANSIVPRKGLMECIAALDRVSPEVRDRLELTIIGDGESRAEIEARTAGLGMGGRLRFLGHKTYDELGRYYAASDVLLIPSLADYRSLAGFEGLGYGLVLLSSKYDGASAETVKEGRNGYVIDPLEPDDLAGRLTELALDREKVRAMRRTSLDLYDSRFSLERVAGNIAECAALAIESSGRRKSGR